MFPANQILQGDCTQVLQQLPDAQADLIVTDPPYGVRYRDRIGRTIVNDDAPERVLGAKPSHNPVNSYLIPLPVLAARGGRGDCGQRYLGIELETEYCEVARRRLAHHTGSTSGPLAAAHSYCEVDSEQADALGGLFQWLQDRDYPAWREPYRVRWSTTAAIGFLKVIASLKLVTDSAPKPLSQTHSAPRPPAC